MSKYTAILSTQGPITLAVCPETGSIVGDRDPEKALDKLKHETALFLANSQHAYAGVLPDLEDMNVIDRTDPA